ncbi:MAG: PH domain-containing protein [Traorella sp.]
MNKNDLKWYDRKRIWCGLPWTFTKYGFSDDRLYIEKGFFTTHLYDTRLYRITNTSISRTFLQKIFGLGTIHIDSTDKDLKCVDLVNIRNSMDVKRILDEVVENERIRNKVIVREYAGDIDDDIHDLDYE